MNAGKQVTQDAADSQETPSPRGAPVRCEEAWLQADWDHITAQVNRLQVRIAKATQAGRWGKVHALQRLLSRSHSGKMLDLDSYGFRPERSTADAIEQCFITLAKRVSPQWILEGDIRGCFDNISHELIGKAPTDGQGCLGPMAQSPIRG